MLVIEEHEASIVGIASRTGVFININGKIDKVEVELKGHKKTANKSSKYSPENFSFYEANFEVIIPNSPSNIFELYNHVDLTFIIIITEPKFGYYFRRSITVEASSSGLVKNKLTHIDNNIRENIENNNCFCNRDIELKEFEKIIFELRRSDNPKSKNISTKLFYAKNCKLKDNSSKSVLRQLNSTFLKFGIVKCIHKIHFLAQIYHETDRFKTTTEYDTSKEYKPYIGRGAMQLTHMDNYKIYTAFYNQDSGTNLDFVNDYNIIEEDLFHVFNTAGWFWNQGKKLSVGKIWKPSSSSPSWVKKNNPSFPKKIIKYKYKNENEKTYGTIDFNFIAEKDLVDVISYLVNGGANGLLERRKYLSILKKIIKYENCKNKLRT